MKKKLLVLLFSLATLGLASCGGSNDVASSGATAASASAPVTTTTASTASTPAKTATEPKVNGQVDERTGVAPVVAQLTFFNPYANGGCGWSNVLDTLNPAQTTICFNAINAASTSGQCFALGGCWGFYAQNSCGGVAAYPAYAYSPACGW